MMYVIVMLICQNGDPTQCVDRYVMHNLMSHADCLDLISYVNYETNKRPQGTHVRPICRESK